MANGMMTTIWYDGHQPTGPAGAMTDSADPIHRAPSPQRNGNTIVHADRLRLAGRRRAAEIAMVDDRFVPNALTVPVGTTVTWVNKGSNQHSVQAYDGSFESDKLSPGDRF